MITKKQKKKPKMDQLDILANKNTQNRNIFASIISKK